MSRNWTAEQKEAIDKEGCNIIVSAGAGSGKTAVLTERVLRKLKEGIHVNQLLVLTFTKNAAFEMKERIRKAIKKEPSLKEELDLLDGAYITTFDSFSLSIVKKYHTVKNITPHVQISEPTVLLLEKKQQLEQITEKLYQMHDTRWENFVSKFCVKDDEDIKQAILSIYQQIDMRFDKNSYLEHYIETTFQEEKIQHDIASFVALLQTKINGINEHLEEFSSYVDGDYYASLLEELTPLLESKTYDEIKSHLEVKLPMLPRGSEIEAKQEKEAISLLIKDLTQLAFYQSEEEIKNRILSTKDDVSILVDILKELDQKITSYKQQNDLYEFNDIAKIAISLLEENEEIREEVKNSFQEILIDEYQDTNDLQEHFISLISHNNVYMVGDIKQSIYRFRNANPYIFKEKYDRYSRELGGYKIDLNKNFRSRKEPLDNINLIFKAIMDEEIGGAAYESSHQMVFGNMSYIDNGDTKQNHNLEIYNYNREKDSIYSKEEYEIFLIAKDIEEKVSQNYLVYDKDEGVIRPICYDDFVILIDRTTQFPLYKKIFEYFNIPLTVYKDENVTNADDISMLKNLLRLIIEVKENRFEEAFRYSFMSVGRSFLFRYSDQELFTYLTKNQFKSSTLYQKVREIANELEHFTCSMLLDKMLETFDYYNQLITIGDIEECLIRMDYFSNLSKTVSSLGYGIEEFLNYVELIFKEGLELKVSLNKEGSNSCKIMTIHKSKGLEYYICYYAGLANAFNIRDLNERFLYDKKYGIIVPFYEEGIAPTIYKSLLKEEYLKEEISEKIRLFYVALTRCKEKMIMVANLGEEETFSSSQLVSVETRMKYRSFLHILKSIHSLLLPFIKNIKAEEIPLTKQYQFVKKEQAKQKEVLKQGSLVVTEYIPKEREQENKTFSKQTNHMFTKKEQEELLLGKQLHYLLEIIDWQNPELETLSITPFIKEKLMMFLEHDFIKKHRNDKIYREYEFIELNVDTSYHGVIDLLIESEEELYIIDYKLQNTKDENYVKQLKGYQKVVEKRFHKPSTIYLYSIMNGILEKQ